MGKGSQIVQCEAFAIEIGAELAVRNARIDCNRAGCGVNRHDLVHWLQRQEIPAAVGDGVETVARAENLDFVLGPQKRADLLDRGSFAQAVGTVSEVSRPVGQFLFLHPGRERGDGGTRKGARNQVKERSLVQGRSG